MIERTVGRIAWSLAMLVAVGTVAGIPWLALTDRL